MELIKPDIGLLFWMTVSFLIVLFILKKYAWGPILNMIKERENTIEESLEKAQKAKEEMASVQEKSDRILKEAREERDSIIKEANETKKSIIAQSREDAKAEADKILKDARQSIENEKKGAMDELRSEVADLSIQVAERILREELSSEKKQKEVMDGLLKEVSLN